MREPAEARALLDSMLSLGSAPERQAEYHWSHQICTRFADSAITQNSAGAEEGVSLSAAFGTRHGGSTTNRLDRDALARMAERAERIARNSPEDPEHMPLLGPQDYRESPGRFRAETLRHTPAAIADAVREAIEPARRRGYTASGFFTVGWSQGAAANSRGLVLFDRNTWADYSLTVLGPAGSGHAEAFAESPADISPRRLGEEALETASAAQDPREIEPGEYTVIFEPLATFDFLAYLFWGLAARDADQGATAFAGKAGRKVAADSITIETATDDPELPAPPCGDECLPARPVAWIRNGVLERLHYSRYWAAHKGVQPDAGLCTVRMAGADASVADLIARCEHGLLVKRLWYIRYVDRKTLLLTGMTRDGLFLVENGRVTAPVQNLRFNESPLVFLSNAVALSRPVRVGQGARVPAVMSERFTFSSKTTSV